MIRPCPIALAATLILGGAAAAQDPALPPPEPRGTITGLLGLEAATWYALPEGDPDIAPSAWHETDRGGAVRLVGFPTERPMGRLIVTFTAAGRPAEVTGDLVKVVYSDRVNDRQLSAEGSDVDLSLSNFDREGDMLTISGTISATLIDQSAAAPSIGPRPGAQFNGNFQATMPMVPEAEVCTGDC